MVRLASGASVSRFFAKNFHRIGISLYVFRRVSMTIRCRWGFQGFCFSHKNDSHTIGKITDCFFDVCQTIFTENSGKERIFVCYRNRTIYCKTHRLVCDCQQTAITKTISEISRSVWGIRIQIPTRTWICSAQRGESQLENAQCEKA